MTSQYIIPGQGWIDESGIGSAYAVPGDGFYVDPPGFNLTIAQHSAAIHGNSVPGSSSSVVLGAAPTTGNLLIAIVGVNIALSSVTVNTGSWTVLAGVRQTPGSPNTLATMALYRYVQPGDTATLPAFWTAGSTYWTHQVWEIAGVNGVIANDLIGVHPIPSPNADSAIPQIIMPANSLALVGTTSYNGGSNPSYTGSWILDDANNNNANFGSESGAHAYYAAGSPLDGVITQGTSSPYGAIVVMLNDTGAAITGNPFVRNVSVFENNGSPTTFETFLQPLTGSLWVAYLNWDRGATAAPTFGTGWTQFASQAGSAHSMMFGLYHYVTGGDTSVIPALTTSGTDFFSVTVLEISGGMTGSFGTDHVSDKTGVQASTTSPVTTTSDTTTSSNQLALLAWANYNAGSVANVTASGGWANEAFLDTSNYGTWGVAENSYQSSGSGVQGTINPTANDYTAYIQSIFNGTATGLTINAAVTESMTLTDSVSDLSNDVGAVTESLGLTDSVSVIAAAPPPPMPIIVVIT